MKKILLIEDNQTSRTLLKTLLELEGYTIIFSEINRPDQLIQIIQIERPDLVMMDIHLGKLNGLDLLKQIRQDSTIKTTKVLILSGMDLGHESLSAGADGFIIKPYMPDDLFAWLKEQLL